MESPAQADDSNVVSSAEKNCKYFQILWPSFLSAAKTTSLVIRVFSGFFVFLLRGMGPVKYLLSN